MNRKISVKRAMSLMMTIILSLGLTVFAMPITASAATPAAEVNISELSVGDIIEFGVNAAFDNNPIPWRVVELDVESGIATLFSEYLLERRPYNNLGAGSTHMNWSGSQISEYLNGEFLNNSFTQAEIDAILPYGTSEETGLHEVDGWMLPHEIDISQKIVLPSLEEIDDSGSFNFRGVASRITRYHSNGQWDTSWWLRTPGSQPILSSYVTNGGSFDALGYNARNTFGIRPVLRLDLNALNTPVSSNASVTLSGDIGIMVGEDARYVLSVNNIERLATVTAWIEIDDAYFAGKAFTGLNGFDLLGGVNWTQEGEKWLGRATLINLEGGVSFEEQQEIFEMLFSSKEQVGGASVKLTRIDLSGYDADNNPVFISAAIANDMVNTQVAKYISKYDVNSDGKVDQLDLTAAQLYFLAEDGDDNWSDAQSSDVNGDGVVDIEDLILIVANIEW